MARDLALLLAEPGDAGVEAVGTTLRQQGVPLLRAGMAELAGASWWHAVDAITHTTLRLADGRRLADEQIGVVLNRLPGLPPPAFAASSAMDREYAAAEFHALLCSWLNGLPVAVGNLPQHGQEHGPALHPLGWRCLAAARGMAVGDFTVLSATRRGGSAGLQRLGGSRYPAGSNVAGWYWAGNEAPLHWCHVFGEQGLGYDDDAAGLVLAAQSVGLVQALGLHYAALCFRRGEVGWVLVELLAQPPLDTLATQQACASWLAHELERQT